MKNILVFVVFFLASRAVHAQDAVYNSDTVTYKNNKIYPSKQIQLLYGSTSNKSFAYVFLKRENQPVPSILSKQSCIISEIKKKHGKYYALGKLKDGPWYLNKNVLIDIEGAIDSDEIKLL